jgi:hypothetical protein
MPRKALFSWFAALFALFFVISLLSFSQQNYSLQEAQKVLQAIEKIVYEQLSKEKDVLKKVVLTESELNSYIAYRIETEEEEIMRELRFKLFKDNRIEGKVLIDLTEKNIPNVLSPRMTFYFGGKLEVQNDKARLDLKELFLEGQSIQPKLLDLVIFIASKIEKTEVWSINDWFELPYGIKNIETQEGKAIFYY